MGGSGACELVPDSVAKMPGVQLILGMSILRHLHLYIAYSDRELIFAPLPAGDVAAGHAPPLTTDIGQR